jgi:4-hydroxy-tetrahydrodipicolinate synthase
MISRPEIRAVPFNTGVAERHENWCAIAALAIVAVAAPALPHKIELFVPAITPFAADLSVDHPRFVAHAKALLATGAHGLAPFGTTIEANSLSVAERMAALEELVDAGIPAEVLIPGTGCCAAADTIAL